MKTKRRCRKILVLQWGSASCERSKGHKGLHRQYARPGPGGTPARVFSDATAKRYAEMEDP